MKSFKYLNLHTLLLCVSVFALTVSGTVFVYFLSLKLDSDTYATSSTYYVSPAGTDNSTCDLANPCDTLKTVLDNFNNIGDTAVDSIVFLDGTYIGPNNGIFMNVYKQVFEEGLIIRAENPYQAKLVNQGRIFRIGGTQNVTIEGFEMYHDNGLSSCSTSNYTSYIIHIDDVTNDDNGVTFIDGHDFGSKKGPDTINYDSDGKIIDFGADGDIFTSNITIRNNIIRSSACEDLIKIQSGGDILIEDNIFYDTAIIDAGTSSTAENAIDINSAVNVEVQNNIFFQDYSSVALGTNTTFRTGPIITVKDSSNGVASEFASGLSGSFPHPNGYTYSSPANNSNSDSICDPSGSNCDTIPGSNNIQVHSNVFMQHRDYDSNGNGDGLITFGAEDKRSYVVLHSAFYNNLIIGSGDANLQQALFTEGTYKLNISHNTFLGEMYAKAYVLRAGLQGYPVPEQFGSDGLIMANNIFDEGSASTATQFIRSVDDTNGVDTTDSLTNYTIENNIFHDSDGTINNLLINDSNQSITLNNLNSDPELTATVSLGDPLVPIYTTGQGFQNINGTGYNSSIEQAFSEIVNNYAAFSPTSIVIDQADPALTPSITTDILGRSRGSSPDLGALELNQPPDAKLDTYTIDEDTTLNNSVRTNDTDPESPTSALTVTLSVGVSNGSLTLNSDGTFSYTPDPDYSGSDTFTYTLSDPSGATDTGTVNITITPINDSPTANPDSYTYDTQTTTLTPSTAVIANDTDPDTGDTLTASVASVATTQGGTVSMNPNGTFTYNPPSAAYTGNDTFTYTATDTGSLTDTATVTIDVTGVAATVNAANDSYTTDEDTLLTVNVANSILNNDTGGDTLQLESSPSDGTLTLNSNGSFTYDPDPDFNGTDSFDYTITNSSSLDSDTATVTITVDPVNDLPTANNDSYTTNEDIPITSSANVLANDTDVELPKNLTVVSTQVVSGSGSINISTNGDLQFTPTSNWSGSFTANYTVRDADGGEDTALITITVDAINDPPVVNAGSSLAGSLSSSFALSGSVTDDSHPGTTLTYVWSKVSGPGNVSFSDTALLNPTAQFSTTGSYTLRLTATDTEHSVSDDISVVVTAPTANRAPDIDIQVVGGQFIYELDEINLDATVTDPDGDNMTYNWKYVSGPRVPEIINPNSLNAVLLPKKPGQYVISFTATDVAQVSTTEQIALDVIENTPPVIEQFGDITWRGNKFNLEASISDLTIARGSELSYAWSLLSYTLAEAPDEEVKVSLSTDSNLNISSAGNEHISIDKANSPKPSVTVYSPGEYNIQLIVSDGALSTSKTFEIVFTEERAAGETQVDTVSLDEGSQEVTTQNIEQEEFSEDSVGETDLTVLVLLASVLGGLGAVGVSIWLFIVYRRRAIR